MPSSVNLRCRPRAVKENDDLQDSWVGHIQRRGPDWSSISLHDEEKASRIQQCYSNHPTLTQKLHWLVYGTILRGVNPGPH